MIAAVATLPIVPATAQTHTSRPIKIVVPGAPGGATDILARLLAQQIGRPNGPTMLIENRPGAGSVVGTMIAIRVLSIAG
jgi:tripartite-type tricarboxylate transporter receptor subunit TctC